MGLGEEGRQGIGPFFWPNIYATSLDASPRFREGNVTQEGQRDSQLQDQKLWKRDAFCQAAEQTKCEEELLEHREHLGGVGSENEASERSHGIQPGLDPSVT